MQFLSVQPRPLHTRCLHPVRLLRHGRSAAPYPGAAGRAMNATSSLIQDRFDNKRAHSVCAFLVCAVACGMGAATTVGCGAAQQAYMDGNEAVDASGAKRSSGALPYSMLHEQLRSAPA